MPRLSAKNLTVPQMKANAAGIKAQIASKPKGDPTGMGLKGQALTGATVNKKRGGSVKKKKGLYYNINKRKKAGTSRSKKKSTISPKAYANMKKGFPKKKKK